MGGADIGRKTNGRRKDQTMIHKYEIDIIQFRRCLSDACEELFSDMTVANRIYERIDDVVEDFLDDNIEAPTIEPKRGEWICHKGRWIDFDYYPTKYECNQCHHYVDVASDKNYCPNCGADMRGADDE